MWSMLEPGPWKPPLPQIYVKNRYDSIASAPSFLGIYAAYSIMNPKHGSDGYLVVMVTVLNTDCHTT